MLLPTSEGYVGEDVLETIDYTNGGRDPKDDFYFTYYLTKDRKSLQLLAFMEEQVAYSTPQSLRASSPKLGEQVWAADYENRFPKVYGKKLGVLVSAESSTLNTPVQELSSITSGSGYVDVVNTDDTLKAIINEDEILEGTGSTLLTINPKSSCKRIKQTGGSKGNGVYTISPVGEEFQVYCDMETDGGGWTAATMLADTTTQNLFDTGNTEEITSITDNISSKGSISDIWKDDENKDISLQCITNNTNLKNFEIPLIIYDFRKEDIGNLESSNKNGNTFSTQPLNAQWNNNKFVLDGSYAGGGVTNQNMTLIRNGGNGTNAIIFGIDESRSINTSDAKSILGPAYNSNANTPIVVLLDENNYCISYIR